MNSISPNSLKSKWLDSRGGRTEGDVLKDEKGEYILVGDGYGFHRRCYIPSEEWLEEYKETFIPVQVRDTLRTF